ncbi:hypothetical protein SUGI_0965410 [Cryptomeria japonica]|nr:hypothetical protein SUGI_0965410 [Cryptomeria japonica]
MATPREHIEQIRREKFSIGREENPLVEDLHHAVKHLSAELYTKDVHFLMELIQNVEDNDYAGKVEPSVEFVITNRDITGMGAPATLLVFNNEKGFTSKNIESVCSVGRSTKKGKSQGGDYIGEKGIGFKSVFLVSRHPYIFSNGYQIRFNEIPPPDTKIGYIVPEWVDEKPNVQDILNVYGGKSVAELPNTVIILPLRHEKVDAVEEQLANIHPEVILFLSKIKRFSVREENQKRVNSISVSKETAFRSIKNEESESFILHLSAEENDESNEECSYYMWRQRFPVKNENRVEGRDEVDNWVITLAFPRDQRVTTSRNKVSAGIYAFLPTEMVTGLPFIIQADFMLVSSRESIRWDNKWNQGILDCVPTAFCSAFTFLVKSVDSAPPSSRSSCFDKYLPIRPISYPQLESVRQAIQTRLKTEEIILCEGHNTYCTPSQARRIVPNFRKILQKSTNHLNGLCSNGVFVIHPCMVNLQSLVFLGVQYVSFEWYSLYITSDPTWVRALSEVVYVQLLCFVAQYWMESEIRVKIHPFPLLKYHNDSCPHGVDWISLTHISASDQHRIYFCQNVKDAEWLIRWNKELGGPTLHKFLPKATQMAIKNQRPGLLHWLDLYAKITDLSLSSFIQEIVEEIFVSRSKELVVRVAQFLHYSAANNYIDSTKMQTICSKLPILSESGSWVRNWQTKLFPAAIGKWAKLMGENRWAAGEAIILSADYLSPPACALQLAGGSLDDLTLFMTSGLNAKDIPHLKPPNSQVTAFPFLIGKEEAILLLSWIQHLLHTSSRSLPAEFKTRIMETKWLKTSRGYQSPNMCFLLDCEWSQAGLQSSDLSFIDCSFYGRPMDVFKVALRYIGGVVKFGEGCEVVAKHLQMHTDFQAITRLYKYLNHFDWKPKDEDSVIIWIPSHGDLGDGGEWKNPKMCIIHDDWDISNHNLHVLENIYEASLLTFFSANLEYLCVPEWRSIATCGKNGPLLMNKDYCNM